MNATAQATQAAVEIPPEVKAKPTAQEVITTSGDLVANAEAFVVASTADYAAGTEILARMRGAYKRLEDERLGITRIIDASKKRVMDFFSPHTSRLETAANILKGKLTSWDDEQERIAAAARRKAEDEARRVREDAERRARQEREEADAKARREREEADRQRVIAEAADKRRREQAEAAARAQREADEARARGDAEAAERARAEQERAEQARRDADQAAADALAAAQRADTKADRAEARAEARVEALEVEAASAVAPVIESNTVKVAGAAKRMRWRYEILDAGKLNRTVLTPDEQKIAKLVNSLHEDAAAVIGEPGAVRIWPERDLSVRGKD